MISQQPYIPPVHLDLDPSTVHEIAPSGPVWLGRDRVGEVSRILLDEQGRVQGVVIRRGGLRRHEVVVPAGQVQEVVGTNVHLGLTPDELEHLPRYQEG